VAFLAPFRLRRPAAGWAGRDFRVAPAFRADFLLAAGLAADFVILAVFFAARRAAAFR
jgi:hypothetical protein